MKPKTLFTTKDRICNNIFSSSFNELFDLLYSLPGATSELVIGSLNYLVVAAASRSSLTFAVECTENRLVILEGLLKTEVQPVIRK